MAPATRTELAAECRCVAMGVPCARCQSARRAHPRTPSNGGGRHPPLARSHLAGHTLGASTVRGQRGKHRNERERGRRGQTRLAALNVFLPLFRVVPAAAHVRACAILLERHAAAPGISKPKILKPISDNLAILWAKTNPDSTLNPIWFPSWTNGVNISADLQKTRQGQNACILLLMDPNIFKRFARTPPLLCIFSSIIASQGRTGKASPRRCSCRGPPSS